MVAQLVRVHNFMVSSDGYGAGEGQSLERPFGHADLVECPRPVAGEPEPVGELPHEVEHRQRRREPQPGSGQVSRA